MGAVAPDKGTGMVGVRIAAQRQAAQGRIIVKDTLAALTFNGVSGKIVYNATHNPD